MIEKDENPKSFEKQGNKMIMPGPHPIAVDNDRNRKTAIKLIELAIDLLRTERPLHETHAKAVEDISEE